MEAEMEAVEPKLVADVDPLVCKGGVDDRFRGFQDLPVVAGVNLRHQG